MITSQAVIWHPNRWTVLCQKCLGLHTVSQQPTETLHAPVLQPTPSSLQSSVRTFPSQTWAGMGVDGYADGQLLLVAAGVASSWKSQLKLEGRSLGSGRCSRKSASSGCCTVLLIGFGASFYLCWYLRTRLNCSANTVLSSARFSHSSLHDCQSAWVSGVACFSSQSWYAHPRWCKSPSSALAAIVWG